ncbi:hypothetical protein M378DRAFT_155407 [Amanita muscaria Koide BX008]|uniref:Phosphoglycerate mutase n=1 Tax=Amanita muscaria (strain Koide BX008) TaxID=946122 RepID=A0A0C2XRC9_AMAMK|nr:hypothetical protein M378DRAFT_155407 [Amanita muscaria Koide BX008]
MPRPSPRLIVLRHGETRWTISGRHTGLSDIPLTKNGEDVVKLGAPNYVGEGRLIDPGRCYKVLVSPRQRALRTFKLAFAHTKEPPHVVAPDVQEWNYGDYDGFTSSDIHKMNPTWDIWTDGCPGGESVEEMQARVDGVIAKVHQWHREYLEDNSSNKPDVMVVAHGHFSRVLVARWLGYPLPNGKHFNIGTASITVLGYAHGSLSEPVLDVLNIPL